MDAYTNARHDVVNNGTNDGETQEKFADSMEVVALWGCSSCSNGANQWLVPAMINALDARFDRLDAKLDRMFDKWERKLDALPTRRFTVWLAVISTVINITVIVLAEIYAASRGH